MTEPNARMSEGAYAAMCACYDERRDCVATGCPAYDDCFLSSRATGRDKTFEMFRAERAEVERKDAALNGWRALARKLADNADALGATDICPPPDSWPECCATTDCSDCWRAALTRPEKEVERDGEL